VSRPDLYISGDVETDGPIPGPYSMLSFGLCVVATFDGRSFERVAHRPAFSRLLRPTSEDFQPEALAVNGLDRERLLVEGSDPAAAMRAAAAWVREQSEGRRPVLVAYPVAFDWSWLYWYFERYAPGGSPFGHSSCLDIRTLFLAAAGTVFDDSGKDDMPDVLRPSAPHTHDALDDAIEQGELFANVFEWNLQRLEALRRRDTDLGAPDWLSRRVVPIT